MACNIIKLSNHKIISNKTYFFDNNIWMFLFCPIGNNSKIKQTKISNFLSDLISRNCIIITNSLIISEFANSYLRLDFDLFKKNGNINANFKKDYFNTSQCYKTKLAIESSIRQIDKISEKYSDQYNSINLENIFTLYKYLDFNDSYFIELCEKNNWIFVTDDSDFDLIKNPITIIKP